MTSFFMVAAFGVGSLLFCALVGWILVTLSKSAKEKRATLLSRVASRGFGYLPEDPARTRYFTGAPFGTNFIDRARDVVWGRIDDRPFETFTVAHDRYPATTAPTGDARDSQLASMGGPEPGVQDAWQVTWVPLPGSLPTTRVQWAAATWRGLALIGEGNVRVESAEFSEIWRVTSADPRIGHAVLTPRMIERFLELDVRDSDFSFEGSALWMTVPEATDLRDIDSVVEMLYSIVDLVPPFLFADASGGEAERSGEAV
jgi:hypothetical protein